MGSNLPELVSSRFCVRLGELADVAAIVQYYTANQAHLQPYEPIRSAVFYSQWYWSNEVEARVQQFYADKSLRLFIFERDRRQIIGVVNFNCIVRGFRQSASLGYSLAADKQGQGYMSEALSLVLPYAFENLKLRRITAAYMPHNTRSGKLLQRMGFRIDGRAHHYLQINGRWEDHILTSLVKSAWQSQTES
ncbi:GNAT family N-acetyltransferase [Almyronema epifaneia]|uniref:GNAT family N-acetyltransferase n=1 Tax=Almyronema epifaneia S1 TaxID=2991925 RepID=A0ABW6IH42_9CYAN